MAAAPPPKHHPSSKEDRKQPDTLDGALGEDGEGRMGGRAEERGTDCKVFIRPEGRGPGRPLLPSCRRYWWISVLAPQIRGENH